MRKLSIAVLAVVIAMLMALTGCGGGGGGGGSKSDTGSSSNTIVSGTVVDNRSPAHAVQGVVVTLGTMQTSTDANGKFTFNLGPNVSVSSLFSDPSQAYFKVSTRNLDQSQYPQVNVAYQGVGYEQIAENGGASIPLPFEVYTATATTKDLGLIVVQFNDPNNPPPIPF